jgi:bifunctional DNA-binding transcriptional regulator/antitoxin component of YhaV-PrlF toxin-antitoxin module
MRITSKGQVTSPQEVRECAELTPGSARRSRGRKLIECLRGRGDFRMTTDEIVALMRGPAADEG